MDTYQRNPVGMEGGKKRGGEGKRTSEMKINNVFNLVFTLFSTSMHYCISCSCRPIINDD